MVPIKKPAGGMMVTVLLLALMSVCIVGIWLRNRDLLRDLFDYTLVVNVTGKLEAGLKPYADVRSPIQSAIYLLNYGTERLLGRNYLALTWGGLVQSLGGAVLVWALLRPALSRPAATLLALAVSLAGLIQHTVFFYNPVGVLCLSVVVLGLALEPALWPLRSWKTAAIGAALFLGGINKLNFQGATLVLAGLLSFAAWASGRMTPGAVARNLLLLVLCGCVLPLAFELAWTGATFAQWLENVVLLPSQRHGYLKMAFDPRIYLRPAHDYYHHIPIRAIGGIGLLLLLVTGAWLLQDARANRLPLADRAMRVLLVLAGAGLGALLIVTNHETIMLTSLAYPVMAAAFYLRYRGAGRAGEQWLERVLLGAMAIWAAAGGYAAWHGSRVLFAPNPPEWSSYVRLQSESRALAYFNGVKMPPAQILAWEMAAAKLKTLENADGRIEKILFGPGMEWLERVYPESITRHGAIGYMGGITLREQDLDYMRDVCLERGQRPLVAQKDWESWPNSIREMLARDYRREEIGGRDVIYHPRGPRPPAVEANPPAILPADFRHQTDGNVLITTTRASPGMGFQDAPGGAVFGADRSTNWSWPLGAGDFQGKAVVRLKPGRERPGVVIFRIVEGDPEAGALWEMPVTVEPAQKELVVPFTRMSGGRPLWLQTLIREEDRGSLIGGWREMRITRSNDLDRSPALPFAGNLLRARPAQDQEIGNELWYATAPETLLPENWVRLPAENWRRVEAPPGTVRVQVEFIPDEAAPGDRPVLILGWYRAGRFEIMTEQAIDLQATRSVTMQAWVTEPGGWVGLLARCSARNHRMRITAWEKVLPP